MSENVIISEGGIGRKFEPVNRLKINNQNSGQLLWVGEDTVKIGDVNITDNGVYSAVEDELYAYDEVTVDVPEDLDDPSQAGSVTGHDPTDGNDYEYNLNEDGNLDVSMIPAAIHIVVPPRKLKYEEGEEIDFTGIHVYLMDGNNRRYTDTQYPTGEIPFDELMFPVTIAENDEQREWSGNGINAVEVHYTQYDVYDYKDPPRPTGSKMRVSEVIGVGERGDYFLGDNYDDGATTLLVTQYNNCIYAARIEGNSDGLNLYVNNNGIFRLVGGTSAISLLNVFDSTGWVVGDVGITTLIMPVSTVNPEDKSVDGLTPSGKNGIPVQWMRFDGEILEDTFEIEVGEGGEPGPPEPDPWAGDYDVSWNGHTYNINRRIVPEVHYANGYCWQEGTTEYTVEQAVGFGWLVRVGM